MVKDNSKEFGKRVVNRIREHLQSNQTTWSKLRGDDVAAIVQSEFDSVTGEPELQFASDASVPLPELGGAGRTRKKSPERNPLFDALYVSTTSGSLAEITKSQAATVATALRDIKRVTPDLTPEEIQRRAECYKRNHRDWALTPTSLAKHWAEWPKPKQTDNPLNPYMTPCDWRERFARAYPDFNPPPEWNDLAVHLRTEILRKTS